MPHFVVYNARPDTEIEWREELAEIIENAVLGVAELGLNQDDPDAVTVSMPVDPSVPAGDYKPPITVIGEVFFDKPERTLEVRRRVAQLVYAAVKHVFPDRKVEVALKRFDPEKDAFVSD